MSQKIIRRIHRWYGVMLSILLVAVGVCLMVACVSIYKSGESPFTRESIGAHFAQIAVLVYVTVAGVAGGVVLSVVLPTEMPRTTPARSASSLLKTLTAKLSAMPVDEATRTAIRRERRLRRGVYLTATVVCVAAAVLLLVWCMDRTHFSVVTLQADIVAAAVRLLACTVVVFGCCAAATYLCEASVKRETAQVKAALAAAKRKATVEASSSDAAVSGAVMSGSSTYGAPMPSKSDMPSAHIRKRRSWPTWLQDPRWLWGIRGLIAVIAVVCIVLGVCNGGMADVLGKAVRICTECIGLG